MATTVKVISVGNSSGVILPKETLARLNVQRGDTLYITEGPEGIRLSPFDEEFARADGSRARDYARESGRPAKAGGVNEPTWIRQDVVLAMHEEALLLHGGPEGVRDVGLLESALARPRNLFVYSEEPPSLSRLAASYAKGIVANHAFVDGNKRTAFTVSLTFLRLNGLEVTASKEDRVVTFWNLAEGSLSEDQLAAWFERKTAPR